jgi:hypothetical protein
MLTLATLWVLGQVMFIEHPLPGVEIGAATPFTNLPVTNYAHGDMNRDGHADLLLPGTLYLQTEGTYDRSNSVAMPSPGQDTDAAVFAGKLYYLERGRLSIYQLDGHRWKQTLSQSLPVKGSAPFRGPSQRANHNVRFRPFLQDLDDDGTPELVEIDQRGVHLFRLSEQRYLPAGTLGLPDETSITLSAPQEIWPAASRQVMFPELQISSRFVFDGPTLRVISVLERQRNNTQYAIVTRSLALDGEGTYQASDTAESLPEPMPPHLRPCQLNSDTVLDFAGGRWLRSEASPLPTPVFELMVTLDGGETFHVRRAAAYSQFRPHCSFVDFDGDGDKDMVMESTEWPRSSIRELVNRFLTESRIRHTIRVYRQDGEGFSKKAALTCTVRIELGAPPVRPGPMFSRYTAGTLFNLTGDFNGDGFRDLATRTGPKQLSIYLAQGWNGMSTGPVTNLSIPEDANAQVADLNHDGLSDIYIRPAEIGDDKTAVPGIAYYAQRIEP